MGRKEARLAGLEHELLAMAGAQHAHLRRGDDPAADDPAAGDPARGTRMRAIASPTVDARRQLRAASASCDASPF